MRNFCKLALLSALFALLVPLSAGRAEAHAEDKDTTFAVHGTGVLLDEAIGTADRSALQLRFDLDELSLPVGEGSLLRVDLEGESSTMSIAFRPSAAAALQASIILSPGGSYDEERGEVLGEQGYLGCIRGDGGDLSVVCISAYQTTNLLNVALRDWNFSVNTWSFQALADFEGTPKNDAQRNAYAGSKIKSFLESNERVSVRLFIRSAEETEGSLKIEQLGSERYYDVPELKDLIFVREEDLGYRAVTLRWEYEADPALCGGIILTRIEEGTVTKTLNFPVSRSDYKDEDLSQKKTYSYILEFVDDTTIPVPKVRFRSSVFTVKPKQGKPWIVVSVLLGALALCAAGVTLYAFLPDLKKRLFDKRGNS